MFKSNITRQDAIKSVQAKYPSGGISVHDYNTAILSTLQAMQKAERAKYKPKQNTLAYLYREFGALGIASHWSYSKPVVVGQAYELTGFYDSCKYKTEDEFILWHDMIEIV